MPKWLQYTFPYSDENTRTDLLPPLVVFTTTETTLEWVDPTYIQGGKMEVVSMERAVRAFLNQIIPPTYKLSVL